MALKIGLLGKKIGMTQVFAEDGESIPVTVIQTGPNVVVGTRTPDRDGYSALVLGFDEKPVRLANKAELGAMKAANGKPQRFVRELRLPAEEVAKFQVGQVLGAQDVFADNIPIDVEGMSKGRVDVELPTLPEQRAATEPGSRCRRACRRSPCRRRPCGATRTATCRFV